MRFIIYHQFGYQDCIQTIILLSTQDFGSIKSLSKEKLKASYKNFLNKLQPNIPVSQSLECEFIENNQKSHELIKCFNINLKQEGINQLIENDSLKNPISKIKEHLEILEKLDPFLHSLFDLAINTVFSGGSSHAVGGTTSAAIGIVWGNPENGWKACDYLEYFVHELTHTLMFLDELRFRHYLDQEIMYRKENFSLSAILQAERPIDRVLHSIVVATEILVLRSRNLLYHSECQIHPNTEALIDSTLTAIDKLKTHPNINKILTLRSFAILEKCHQSITNQMSYSL